MSISILAWKLYPIIINRAGRLLCLALSAQLQHVLQLANLVPRARRACGHSCVMPYTASQLAWLHMKQLCSFAFHLHYDWPQLRDLCIVPHWSIHQRPYSEMAEMSLQAAFATRERSRHTARKENTCTQIHHDLSICAPREICTVYQTGPLLLNRCCPLIFSFQKN